MKRQTTHARRTRVATIGMALGLALAANACIAEDVESIDEDTIDAPGLEPEATASSQCPPGSVAVGAPETIVGSRKVVECLLPDGTKGTSTCFTIKQKCKGRNVPGEVYGQDCGPCIGSMNVPPVIDKTPGNL